MHRFSRSQNIVHQGPHQYSSDNAKLQCDVMGGWTLLLWSNYMFTFFKQKQQSEKYLVQPTCWHMTPKVQHFIDMQQDFVVFGLIGWKEGWKKF